MCGSCKILFDRAQCFDLLDRVLLFCFVFVFFSLGQTPISEDFVSMLRVRFLVHPVKALYIWRGGDGNGVSHNQ